MATRHQVGSKPGVVIDLASTPYFTGDSGADEPLLVREGSSRERVRDTADEATEVPNYRVDRIPAPRDPQQHFGGGLGTASVLDVTAHPIRARARHFDVLTVLAISVIAGVATVILTFVATFRY